jgi:signal transduction histidine kinase
MITPSQSLATRSTVPVVAVSRMRNELAIHLSILLVVTSVYIWSLSASLDLRTPARLIPFSVLVLLHACLLVLGPRLSPRRRWLPIYFTVQGILIFFINQITGIIGAAYGWYLYLGLAAQAAGLLNHRSRLAVLAAAGYLALALIHYVWLWGLSSLPAFLLLALPQSFFVIAFVILFFRQVKARQRAQELLSDLEVAHRELESAHRQLAEYAARVEDLTLLNERQRMARELHDTLAQGLAGLTCPGHRPASDGASAPDPDRCPPGDRRPAPRGGDHRESGGDGALRSRPLHCRHRHPL